MQPWSSTVLAKEELLRWRDNLEACNGRVDGTQMETSEFSRADEDEPITKTLEEDEDRWRRDFKPPEQYCELTA